MQVKLKAGILWCEKLVSFYMDGERGWRKKERKYSIDYQVYVLS
jgi:hypothetical protein